MLLLLAAPLSLVGPKLTGPRQTLLYGSVAPHPLRVKQAIFDFAAETNGGSKASERDAAEFQVLAELLESNNSCKAPTGSMAAGAEIDGEWYQIYTSNTMGITYGNGRLMKRKLIGPLSGRVTQLVDTSFGTYRQRIQTRLGLVRGQLDAEFTPVDAFTWAVTFTRFTVSAFRLPLRSRAAEYQGEWTHTYVDANTRIMRTKRAAGGGEFLFVLRRRLR